MAHGEASSRIAGWATIKAVGQPGDHCYNLADAVEIVFDFAPEGPRARDVYAIPAVGDRDSLLTVGAGANPPRQGAARMGMRPSSRQRCLRREFLRGVGTPVVYEFPDIDDAPLAAEIQAGGPKARWAPPSGPRA